MLVTKEFTFDSAHFLPNYHGKCENMHGHTYRLQVTVDGPVNSEGLVIDFALLKKIVTEKVLSKLDHHIINDTIKIASAENTAIWIWNRLVDLPEFSKKVHLHEIKLWETPNSFVTYHGK
ncbi:6-carboxytetrahydropterin synthase QueD [Patescibacteria group bacterium]|nr:6-carboxytetrahydropterin synthase QueD [Patescibacteria group bacterium]MBU1016202.1 6-carboxytetrahydropterin synthase QueD [Patescibacteria group bacterium]MBU1684681.1 6-carboxytetrahydropterin synthase QueD [Patescibacteria group bacterium]MBU1938932.1 6-carboxytetrahydropterin synthase QueD [Patescibacteria group bacterium]